MHFNATVTGYFTLPHKLFTSTLPLGIYLGDFGSSLFFIVSGASLALTVPAEQSPAQFYKRRARAVYPLFWLAWFVVFSYRFVAHPGSFGGARTVTLVLTLLGLDNFAVAAGSEQTLPVWASGSSAASCFYTCCSRFCSGGCAKGRG